MKSITLILTIFLLYAKSYSVSAEGKYLNSEQIQMIKPVIHGNWYQASYIESLKKTKSPYLSDKSLFGIAELRIDTNEIIYDSVLTIGAIGTHEAYELVIHFKRGHSPNSFRTIVDFDIEANSYELAYEIKSDTALFLMKFDENIKVIQSVKYLRVPNFSESALQYMVNQTLFTGTYNAISNSGDTLNLTFFNDGKLVGLPKYTSYYVVTDFVADDYDNAQDWVCFDIQTENQICYAFKILGDTTLLYDYILNYEKGMYEVGNIKYRMERK
jgi:hypothetical protein